MLDSVDTTARFTTDDPYHMTGMKNVFTITTESSCFMSPPQVTISNSVLIFYYYYH